MLGQHGLDKNDPEENHISFISKLFISEWINLIFLKLLNFSYQDRLFLLKYLCLYSDAFDINNPFEPVPHPISRKCNLFLNLN